MEIINKIIANIGILFFKSIESWFVEVCVCGQIMDIGLNRRVAARFDSLPLTINHYSTFSIFIFLWL